MIDDKATAFRAREREELQPTFAQLQRKNANVTMRWFARGKLWESREAERDDFQRTLESPLLKPGKGVPMSNNPKTQVARLDDIERRGRDIPVREYLGIQPFGINAFTLGEDGLLVNEHDEVGSG